MQLIRENLPRTELSDFTESEMAANDPTQVLIAHLSMGAKVTGGVLHLALPQYYLTAVMDVEQDRLTISGTEDHPSRIR